MLVFFGDKPFKTETYFHISVNVQKPNTTAFCNSLLDNKVYFNYSSQFIFHFENYI